MARKYDLEFQKESLRLLYKRNGKLSEVAKSLGIPLSTLKTWEIKMGSSIKKESIKSSKSKDERILELEEENRKLKLERIEYMEENVILKKSVSIILKKPLL